MTNKLYILIGVPGVGKSTIANKLKNKNTIHLSSDNIREEYIENIEDYQKHNAKVFEIMNNKTFELLKEGKNVIYDATNLSRKKRKNLYNQAKKHDTEVIAYCILKPLKTVLKQNNQRTDWKRVPENIIKEKYLSFNPPRINLDCDKILIDGHYQDFLYEIQETIDMPHYSPFHTETIREHIDMTIENAKTNQLKEIAMFHDLGKSICRTDNRSKTEEAKLYREQNKIYHSFYNHANVSSMYYLAYINDQVKYKGRINQYYLENLEVIYQHMNFTITDKLIENNKLTTKEINLLNKFYEIDKKSAIKKQP